MVPSPAAQTRKKGKNGWSRVFEEEEEEIGRGIIGEFAPYTFVVLHRPPLLACCCT